MLIPLSSLFGPNINRPRLYKDLKTLDLQACEKLE